MKDKLPVKITVHKKGLKMQYFLSLNVLPGSFCDKMHCNKKSICNQCYGYYMINRYGRLKKALQFNSDILSARILTQSEIENIAQYIINKKDISGLRFNSIGELINDLHMINLQNITYEIRKKDKCIPITLWTKRKDLLFSVIDKPFYNVIESNKFLNSFIDPARDKRISHTFNVYDDKVIMDKAIKKASKNGLNPIVCTGLCSDCLICYGPTKKHYIIFELTKKAQQKEHKKGSAI
jgi:hypothetical protein